MTTYISLLRGINVGGRKKMRMTDLKSVYESLHFSEVITYLQSGNVIFRHDSSDHIMLQEQIENSIEHHFGFTVSVIVRNFFQFKGIISNNPFVKRKEAINRLYISFLSGEPEEERLNNIMKLNFSPDEFIPVEREIYLFCPASYGKTKLSNNFFESKLKLTATSRNWKTVTELFRLASSFEL